MNIIVTGFTFNFYIGKASISGEASSICAGRTEEMGHF